MKNRMKEAREEFKDVFSIMMPSMGIKGIAILSALVWFVFAFGAIAMGGNVEAYLFYALKMSVATTVIWGVLFPGAMALLVAFDEFIFYREIK